MPNRAFQILSACFTEPAEKEFVGKAYRERMLIRKGEGQRGEPCFGHLRIKVILEPVFYLHGIADRGRFLPGREGEFSPFAGIGKEFGVCLHERASGAEHSNIGAHGLSWIKKMEVTVSSSNHYGKIKEKITGNDSRVQCRA
jgi:hypothetical protein